MTNRQHTKASVIAQYLPETLVVKTHSASAFAPSNIALCKYWGKRDSGLNLPTNASLSISLGNLGTTTTIDFSACGKDTLYLNAQVLTADTTFFKKVFDFVDYFRRGKNIPLSIHTQNNIPTAAGLASSASGFAALTLALNDFFQLDLPITVLSAFARMGSGSASRSVYSGFVEWHMGTQADGMDSYAHQLTVDNHFWQALRVGVITISSDEKKINSRDGMNRTVETSALYENWPNQAKRDLQTIKQALTENDFSLLGQTAEQNALSMHATMISAWPPVLYWQPQSLAIIQQVWALREQGVELYFTMDAGPNIKLLFLDSQAKSVQAQFADMTLISPLSDE